MRKLDPARVASTSRDRPSKSSNPSRLGVRLSKGQGSGAAEPSERERRWSAREGAREQLPRRTSIAKMSKFPIGSRTMDHAVELFKSESKLADSDDFTAEDQEVQILVRRNLPKESSSNLDYRGVRFRLSRDGDLYIVKVPGQVSRALMSRLMGRLDTWTLEEGRTADTRFLSLLKPQQDFRGSMRQPDSIIQRMSRSATTGTWTPALPVCILEVEDKSRGLLKMHETVEREYFQLESVQAVVGIKLYPPRARKGQGLKFEACALVWVRGPRGEALVVDKVSFGSTALQPHVETAIRSLPSMGGDLRVAPWVDAPADADVSSSIADLHDQEGYYIQNPAYHLDPPMGDATLTVPGNSMGGPDLKISLWKTFCDATWGQMPWGKMS